MLRKLLKKLGLAKASPINTLPLEDAFTKLSKSGVPLSKEDIRLMKEIEFKALNLSVYSFNMICRSGITLKQLLLMTDKEIMTLFKGKCVAEILCRLNEVRLGCTS